MDFEVEIELMLVIGSSTLGVVEIAHLHHFKYKIKVYFDRCSFPLVVMETSVFVHEREWIFTMCQLGNRVQTCPCVDPKG